VAHVLLIDDNPLYGLGLRELVKSAHPALGVSEARTFASARSLLRECGEIALILFDFKTHDSGGFVGLFQLRTEFPNIPVIVLSANADADLITRAVSFGAAGFVLKSAPCDAVLRSVSETLSGLKGPLPIVVGQDQGNPVTSLSPALWRVLMGIKRGLRNKEIAFELGLSEKTIKAYLSLIYRKLGVGSRAQALILVQDFHVETRSPLNPEGAVALRPQW
jgi:DNA-binding NarL/FixJ family response regulator